MADLNDPNDLEAELDKAGSNNSGTTLTEEEVHHSEVDVDEIEMTGGMKLKKTKRRLKGRGKGQAKVRAKGRTKGRGKGRSKSNRSKHTKKR